MLVRSIAEWQADGWRGKAAEWRATRLEAGVLVSLLEGLRQREQGESVGSRTGKHPPAVSWVSFGGSLRFSILRESQTEGEESEHGQAELHVS